MPEQFQHRSIDDREGYHSDGAVPPLLPDMAVDVTGAIADRGHSPVIFQEGLTRMFSRLFRREKTESSHSGAPALPSNRYKVLVVDDDVHLRELLKAALEHNGYTVFTGETGADAVRLGREIAPDLIVLDGNMPVMDGFDALKRLRTVRSTEKIPIIMLTMRSHQVDMLTGYRFGAQEYLTKPVVVEQLLVSVRRLLSAR